MARLRKSWDGWLTHLCLESEDKFVEYLRQSGRALELDNVVVDKQEAFRRHFTCDTTTCDPNMRGRAMRSCCCELTVDLTWNEVRRIEENLPQIREVMEDADQAPGLQVLDKGRFYEMAEGFTPQLAKHRWGCVFAYREKGQAFRCAVHAAALRHGLPVTSVKPNICSMWPLILIEYQPQRYVISAITDETGPLLDDDEKHAHYACLRNDQKGPPLYRDFAPLLSEMFGAPFIGKLDVAYAEWEAQAAAKLSGKAARGAG